MAGKDYTIIDHTADIGLEATGSDLNDAFVNAAGGMFDILSDDSYIESLRSFDVVVEGDTLEDLLVDYLTRLLILYEVEGYLFCEFGVEISRMGEGSEADVGEVVNREEIGRRWPGVDGVGRREEGGVWIDGEVREGEEVDRIGMKGGGRRDGIKDWIGVDGRVGRDGIKDWSAVEGGEAGRDEKGEWIEVDSGERKREGFILIGYAKGEPFDIGKHKYPLEIKAVTYHMLEVREDPAMVRVIFDL